MQIHAGPELVPLVSVSPYEPYLVDSVDWVLMMPPIFLMLTILLPLFLDGFPELQGVEPKGDL